MAGTPAASRSTVTTAERPGSAAGEPPESSGRQDGAGQQQAQDADEQTKANGSGGGHGAESGAGACGQAIFPLPSRASSLLQFHDSGEELEGRKARQTPTARALSPPDRVPRRSR